MNEKKVTKTYPLIQQTHSSAILFFVVDETLRAAAPVAAGAKESSVAGCGTIRLAFMLSVASWSQCLVTLFTLKAKCMPVLS